MTALAVGTGLDLQARFPKGKIKAILRVSVPCVEQGGGIGRGVYDDKLPKKALGFIARGGRESL
jgi:hypothetical protein